MRPLLVIDGDSFAHRAYHALPKSMRRADGGPANALIGFSDMLLRLWQAERPRAVLVGVGHARRPDVPARGARGVPERDGSSTPSCSSSSISCRRSSRPPGFACAKTAGYEADDFLAAAVDAERKRPAATALVATSDRDAFQLVSGAT